MRTKRWLRWCILYYRWRADSAEALLLITAATAIFVGLVPVQEEMHRLSDVQAVQRVVVAVRR